MDKTLEALLDPSLVFALIRNPRPRLPETMGRTVHYRTQEPVSEEKFDSLKKTITRLNSEISLEMEEIKIWRGKELKENKVWGFTKIKSDEKAELLLEYLKELSSSSPELTWVVYDEGKEEKEEIHLKEGKFSSPE